LDYCDKYVIPGYQKPFRHDRSIVAPCYGGVLAWIADNIACKRRTDLESRDIELLWLEIRSNNLRILLGVIYRPPNTDDSFWDNLSDNLTNIHESHNGKIILIGDLNADLQTRQGKHLQNLIESKTLYSFIDEPTRITDTSSTILDHCLSNCPRLIQRCEILKPIGNSDHCTIAVFSDMNVKAEKAYKRTMWEFKNETFHTFKDSLDSFLCGKTYCQKMLTNIVNPGQIQY